MYVAVVLATPVIVVVAFVLVDEDFEVVVVLLSLEVEEIVAELVVLSEEVALELLAVPGRH